MELLQLVANHRGSGTPRYSPQMMLALLWYCYAKPEDRHQINLIVPDSHLMRKSRRDGWQQAYNAQAVVDADGSQVILGAYVADSSADNREMEPALETVVPEVGRPTTVLADAGYVRKKLITRFASHPDAPELYLAITGSDRDAGKGPQ